MVKWMDNLSWSWLGLCGGLLLAAGCTSPSPDVLVANDSFSHLNPTVVDRIQRPRTIEEVQAVVRDARESRRCVSICGARHAQGGQQLGTANCLIDMRAMNRVLSFDRASGIIDVEAGTQWSELQAYLDREQKDRAARWGIRQKQMGGDDFTIGGSLSANIHGERLDAGPIIEDVESFLLVDAEGLVRKCSREQNAQLFAAAIGGYGLFGVITSVRLRLEPRAALERTVERVPVDGLTERIARARAAGATYGYCELRTDGTAEQFLSEGLLVTCRPTAADPDMKDAPPIVVDVDSWDAQPQSFDDRAEQALARSGERCWSDTRQFVKPRRARKRKKSPPRRIVMTELFVPREKLEELLPAIRDEVVAREIDLRYALVRWAEPDTESFLAWAQEPCATVLLCAKLREGKDGVERSLADQRGMASHATGMGGRYYLTFQRWPDRKEVEAAYPRFVEFLKLKRRIDPREIFQSSWYRHHKNLFLDSL